MIITESRLRRIIRHVLSEAGRQRRMGLGTYKREKKGALEQMRTQIHQTRGQRMGDNEDDGYDSIMGFDEADEIEADELEEADPPKPPGCK